jgi:hypothetical protein
VGQSWWWVVLAVVVVALLVAVALLRSRRGRDEAAPPSNVEIAAAAAAGGAGGAVGAGAVAVTHAEEDAPGSIDPGAEIGAAAESAGAAEPDVFAAEDRSDPHAAPSSGTSSPEDVSAPAGAAASIPAPREEPPLSSAGSAERRPPEPRDPETAGSALAALDSGLVGPAGSFAAAAAAVSAAAARPGPYPVRCSRPRTARAPPRTTRSRPTRAPAASTPRTRPSTCARAATPGSARRRRPAPPGSPLGTHDHRKWRPGDRSGAHGAARHPRGAGDDTPTFAMASSSARAVLACHALRNPLQDGEVRLARAEGTVVYPARFHLVLAAARAPVRQRTSVTVSARR